MINRSTFYIIVVDEKALTLRIELASMDLMLTLKPLRYGDTCELTLSIGL